MGKSFRPYNLRPDRLPPHENIQTVREVFSKIKSQIHIDPPLLSHEFQFNYAVHIKTNWPQLWAMGGLERANQLFDLWRLYREGERTKEIIYWAEKERDRYYWSHKRNSYTVGAVLTAIKWSVTLDIGEDMMFKSVVREALRKKMINI